MCVYRTSVFFGMRIEYDQIERPVFPDEDETIDDLQLNGLRLIQKKTGFRLGMDSVLLADFARISGEARVGDFGTGTGALPLLLWGRRKGNSYFAFEIQKDLAETAARTMVLNGLEDRVNIYADDACRAADILPPNYLDAIICNPPYGEPGSSVQNPVPNLTVSRHQKKDMIQSYLKTAYRLLKGKGRISLIYPCARMLTLMQTMHEAHVEPKRFRLVYPYADKPANLVMIEGVKDAKPMLHTMPPLVIFEKNGSLTSELKSVYHIHE
ncbi:MAG: methyltransferase [Anaerolineaceae bacterium]|nr:methyltransferase [Anaerolineaceae bacterium]